MKPSIGRIVHYVAPSNDGAGLMHCAAIITKVYNDSIVDLTVFRPGSGTVCVSKCVHCVDDVTYNTWHWPEKVD